MSIFLNQSSTPSVPRKPSYIYMDESQDSTPSTPLHEVEPADNHKNTLQNTMPNDMNGDHFNVEEDQEIVEAQSGIDLLRNETTPQTESSFSSDSQEAKDCIPIGGNEAKQVEPRMVQSEEEPDVSLSVPKKTPFLIDEKIKKELLMLYMLMVLMQAFCIRKFDVSWCCQQIIDKLIALELWYMLVAFLRPLPYVWDQLRKKKPVFEQIHQMICHPPGGNSITNSGVKSEIKTPTNKKIRENNKNTNPYLDVEHGSIFLYELDSFCKENIIEIKEAVTIVYLDSEEYVEGAKILVKSLLNELHDDPSLDISPEEGSKKTSSNKSKAILEENGMKRKRKASQVDKTDSVRPNTRTEQANRVIELSTSVLQNQKANSKSDQDQHENLTISDIKFRIGSSKRGKNNSLIPINEPSEDVFNYQLVRNLNFLTEALEINTLNKLWKYMTDFSKKLDLNGESGIYALLDCLETPHKFSLLEERALSYITEHQPSVVFAKQLQSDLETTFKKSKREINKEKIIQYFPEVVILKENLTAELDPYVEALKGETQTICPNPNVSGDKPKETRTLTRSLKKAVEKLSLQASVEDKQLEEEGSLGKRTSNLNSPDIISDFCRDKDLYPNTPSTKFSKMVEEESILQPDLSQEEKKKLDRTNVLELKVFTFLELAFQKKGGK